MPNICYHHDWALLCQTVVCVSGQHKAVSETTEFLNGENFKASFGRVLDKKLELQLGRGCETER